MQEDLESVIIQTDNGCNNVEVGKNINKNSKLFTMLRDNEIHTLYLHYCSMDLFSNEKNLFGSLLKVNTSLVDLTLKGSFLTESLGQVIAALLHHPRLEKIIIRNYEEADYEIDKKFICALAALLYFNPKISHLGLEHLNLQQDITSICEAIENSKTLKKLTFWYMEFSPANSQKLLNAIEKNSSLIDVICGSCDEKFSAAVNSIMAKKVKPGIASNNYLIFSQGAIEPKPPTPDPTDYPGCLIM